MKQWNTLNRRLFFALCLMIVGIILKFFIYKPYDRYNYYASAFTPEEFPIHIYELMFIPYIGTPSFSDSNKYINSFSSYWGQQQSGTDMRRQVMLPEKLFVEYIDFRTKKYYCEEIALPKKAMKEAIKKVNKNDEDRAMRYDDALQIKIGIANEGHIIFWMAGESYQTEFFRTQISPKPFPKKLARYDRLISNKEDFIKETFEDIPDSIQQKILDQKVEHIQYKDSIPKINRY